MKKTTLLFALVLTAGSLFAQRKTTTSAIINFDATTSIDALPKADNKATIASLDTKKGTIAFETLTKNFSFSNPMMQEHFNSEKWMNSDKFPKSSFKGSITNLDEIKFDKDGVYTAEITGDLTMHGETNPVATKATFTVKNKVISASTDFTVKLEDYKINGGAIAAGKVAKEPKISVTAEF